MANLGTKRTEETRAKMSKSQGQTCKSYWRASSFFSYETLSAYTLAKMSTVKSGANNPPYGRAVNILVFSVDGQLVNEFSATLTEAALWLNTSVTF